MQKKFKVFILLVFIFAITSCKEFIEPSIAKKTIIVNSPSNGFKTTTYNIVFWWNELEDATGYRLQIVEPDFNATDVLVADTLIQGDRFSLMLEPGNYEWRLRAENGSSETEFSSPRQLTVHPGTLGEQIVRLQSPANQLLTNIGTVTLSWQSLFGAAKYRLQVDDDSFTEPLIYDRIVVVTDNSIILPKDGIYYWRVQALSEDETQQSRWSAAFSLTYDTTSPEKVTLKTPANGAVLSSQVALTWNTPASAVQYKIYLYQDDGITAAEGFPLLVNASSKTLTLNKPGQTFYWQVAALDAAGNESILSDKRNFTMQ